VAHLGELKRSEQKADKFMVRVAMKADPFQIDQNHESIIAASASRP
jgi:hypothetical protein